MTTHYKFDRLRIGAVQYLNSKPLIQGLTELLPEAELVLDYPSQLADDLANGLLDVALVPSIVSFDNRNYEVISDACVATRGPVLSVKLYCRVPIRKISRLAIDAGSRTSAALVRILLSERYGITPVIEPLPVSQSTESSTADAFLLIGDRALHPPKEEFRITWDLGEEWLNWTGFPFVFALWICRKTPVPLAVGTALCQARDLGILQLEHIAVREAKRLSIDTKTAYEYLTRNLHFYLGPLEKKGLNLFHELAVRCGLVSTGVELVH